MNKLIGTIRSKTMYFSLALVVLGVVQANLGIFSAYLTPEHYGWLNTAGGRRLELDFLVRVKD